MIWTFTSIAPLLVFTALIGFLERARRRALPHTRLRNELHGNAPPAAPSESTERITRMKPANHITQSAFHVLQAVMERGNEDLFAPLQIALVDLVRVGHSIEVCTLDLKQCLPHSNSTT